MAEKLAENLYEFITGEDETHSCEAISEEACHEAPQNFMLNAANGFCTKLAEQLASPGVIFPWLFSTLGVPVSFTSFLFPVKNAGSLLPQLFVSARIRAFAVRKYIWSAAGFSQGLVLIGLAIALPLLTGQSAGYLILSALLLFSVASGVGSIAFKDVMGKTIPKGKRGRLLATRATGGGVLTLLAGLYFYYNNFSDQDITTFIWLLVVAGVLWLAAAVLFYLIAEQSGATEGGRSTLTELKKGWRILIDDKNYRRFLSARVLLMAIPLSQPFIVVFAKDLLDAGLEGLGLFVIISGVSAALSSPFWGKFSDRSSRKLMMFVALFGLAILGYVVSFQYWPEQYQNIYTYSPAFFLVAMAHGGARLSRKTYLVDYAPQKQRPLYISVANTTIGFFTIVSGAIGLIAQIYSLEVLFFFLMACLLGAAAIGFRLEEV